MREAPIFLHSNKQHDLYLIKAWGKARANVPTLKCSINDVASSIDEHDMRSPLSPESFFPGVLGGGQPTGVTEKALDLSLCQRLANHTDCCCWQPHLHVPPFLTCDVGDGEGVIHAWCFTPKVHVLRDVRALEKNHMALTGQTGCVEE